MEYEFKIGWCNNCSQGWAEIVKDIENDHLLIRCTECEVIWNSPEDFYNYNANLNYQVKDKIVDPTLDEITALGWEKFISIS